MKKDLLWLTLVFGGLCFFALGRAALDPKDEGRYAEIPREMVAAHEYVTPRLDGITYFEKPPLMYWAEIGSTQLFGPGEFAVRTPVALICLLGILLTYAAARAAFDRGVGLLSAVVLGTASYYAVFSHILTLDLAVAVLISSTLFCFILGVRAAPGPRRRWLFYGLYASSALATLTKGPIGFLLTGAVMFLWLLLCGQWKRLLPLYLPSGILLFLLIAAPWHILAAQRNEDWARFYFIHENWERFTTTQHGRVGPWYYFIPVVYGGFFPWMGGAPPKRRPLVLRDLGRRHLPFLQQIAVKTRGLHPPALPGPCRPHRPMDRRALERTRRGRPRPLGVLGLLRFQRLALGRGHRCRYHSGQV
jgi:4-amino-4-deoxy-L-arabinose transferase-like glycosyltransferase